MIAGIGLDIVELDRIRKSDMRSPRFRERILTERELTIYSSLSEKRRIEFLAGRFSAKEAFAKARGTGIGEGCAFLDIEVLPDAAGKPVLYFKGVAESGFVSITHTETVAAAQVVLMEN